MTFHFSPIIKENAFQNFPQDMSPDPPKGWCVQHYLWTYSLDKPVKIIGYIPDIILAN